MNYCDCQYYCGWCRPDLCVPATNDQQRIRLHREAELALAKWSRISTTVETMRRAGKPLEDIACKVLSMSRDFDNKEKQQC